MSKETDEFTPILKLLDFCTTITEIRCDECNKIEKSYMDEWESAEQFLDDGWMIVKNKCLCKACNIKK